MSIYPSRKEALETGSKLYTGAPCKKCGSRVRYTSTSNCQQCAQARGREYAKTYRTENPQKSKAAYDNWKSKYPDRYRKSKEKYRKANKAAVNAACAKRKAHIKERTPDWMRPDKILQIYKMAQLASAATGVEHHVDHVVPLRGETVSGLHVENNLEIVPYWENLEKSNRHS